MYVPGIPGQEKGKVQGSRNGEGLNKRKGEDRTGREERSRQKRGRT